MLKLSLGLRITNSRRENLRKELHRGVEVHRLLRTGLAEQWQAAHPGFDIVRDPAWLAVERRRRQPRPRPRRGDPAQPVQPARRRVLHRRARLAPRPSAAAHAAPGQPAVRSRLAESSPASPRGPAAPRGAVAAEWFLRYLEQVVRPVLWLDSEAGIALEAHQQNTLLLLDGEGWPVGGRYRDNQGYYFRASRREELDPGCPASANDSDTFVSDEVTDERFAYYLGINNVLGLIGAFGSQRLADEQLLLSAFRRFLGDVAPARPAAHLPARPSARLSRPALQGQPADPAARPRRTRRPGRHPVRLRHHREPPSFLTVTVTITRQRHWLRWAPPTVSRSGHREWPSAPTRTATFSGSERQPLLSTSTAPDSLQPWPRPTPFNPGQRQLPSPLRNMTHPIP